jgi:hypothetical protein
MGVTVREKPRGSGIWWIFINHQGKRKSKKIGKDRKLAVEAAEKIKAKLVLGKPVKKQKTELFPPKRIDPNAFGVYFIQEEITGTVKIGHTKISIMRRLKSLQTANPAKLRLISYIENAGKDVENDLHIQFKSKRIKGEWFSLSFADLAF